MDGKNWSFVKACVGRILPWDWIDAEEYLLRRKGGVGWNE